jgi:hypothetical protein
MRHEDTQLSMDLIRVARKEGRKDIILGTGPGKGSHKTLKKRVPYCTYALDLTLLELRRLDSTRSRLRQHIKQGSTIGAGSESSEPFLRKQIIAYWCHLSISAAGSSFRI